MGVKLIHSKYIIDGKPTTTKPLLPPLSSEARRSSRPGMDWPMYRRDTKGTNSFPKDFNPDKLNLLWWFQAGEKVGYPIAAEGRVFFGTEYGYFTALDIYTGQELWTKSVPGSAECPPSFSDNTVFVLAPKILYAFNAENGEEKWFSDLGGEIETYGLGLGRFTFPLPCDDVIIVDRKGKKFGSMDKILAFSKDSGEKIWELDTDVDTSPIIVDNQLIVGHHTTSIDDFVCVYALSALNPTSGETLWSKELWRGEIGELEGMISFEMSPISDGNDVFFSTSDGVLYSLNLSGEENWQRSYRGKEDESWIKGRAVADGHLYLSTTENLFSINTQGKLEWKKEIATIGTPIVTKSSIYVRVTAEIEEFPYSTTMLLCIDRNKGKLKWEAPIDNYFADLAFTEKYVLSPSFYSLCCFGENMNPPKPKKGMETVSEIGERVSVVAKNPKISLLKIIKKSAGRVDTIENVIKIMGFAAYVASWVL